MIENTPNAYLILAGDLINNAIKSSVSNCFDDIYRPAEQKKIMAELLKPVKGKILCGTCGNHEDRSSKDVDNDPMYDIFAKLDIEDRYRKEIVFMKLKFGKTNSNSQIYPTYIFAVTHGSGGGALTGGSVNKAERFAYGLDGVDVLITAHTHKPLLTTPAKYRVNPSTNTMTLVPFDVVVASSWTGYSDYAPKKLYTPTSNTIQKITLQATKKEIEFSSKHSYDTTRK